GKARLHGNRRTRSSLPTRQRPAQTPPAVTGRGSLPRARLRSSFLSADDPGLRSIHHYLAGRVRGHVLICMLACYLTWHLRQALAQLTFTSQFISDIGATDLRSALAYQAGVMTRTQNDLENTAGSISGQT